MYDKKNLRLCVPIELKPNWMYDKKNLHVRAHWNADRMYDKSIRMWSSDINDGWPKDRAWCLGWAKCETKIPNPRNFQSQTLETEFNPKP